MSISEVDICNSALDLLGVGRSIVSFTDGTGLANTLRRRYPISRDTVLRMHEWNFAIQRANLPQLEEGPVSGYSYQYQLPTDPYCLRVLCMTNVIGAEYRIEGRRLLTNVNECSIKYISQVTDTTKFDPLFIDVLAVRIAADVAYKITQSRFIAQNMKAEFEYNLQRAKGIDNLEGTEPDPAENTSWTNEGRS